GQTVDAFWSAVMHVPLFSVGVNCALGPREMRAHVEELSKLSPRFVSAYPNAGLPNAFGGFDETPESMARHLGGWGERGRGAPPGSPRRASRSAASPASTRW